MTITLNTSVLLSDIRRISLLELEGIADVEARYRAEAGTEKEDVLRECISAARTRLERRCLRFLDNSYVDEATSGKSTDSTFVFEFAMESSRRADGKTFPLADAMHDFIVEYALARFYSTVSQGDLSNKHSLLALEAGREFDELLHTKLPPRV